MVHSSQCFTSGQYERNEQAIFSSETLLAEGWRATRRMLDEHAPPTEDAPAAHRRTLAWRAGDVPPDRRPFGGGLEEPHTKARLAPPRPTKHNVAAGSAFVS